MNLRDLQDDLEKLLSGFKKSPARHVANFVAQPVQGQVQQVQNMFSDNPNFANRVVRNVGNTVKQTGLDFGNLVLGAGYEGQRAVRSAMGDQKQYGVDPVTGKAYNTNPFLNENTLSKYSNPVTGAMDAGGKTFKAGAMVYGIPKLTIGGVASAAGFGGGINVGANKLFGDGSKSTMKALEEGITAGASSAPTLAGIGRITNPAIAKYANIVGNKFTSPGVKQLATRIAAGGLNIPEGAVMSKSLGYNATDPLSIVTDFATGFAAGRPIGARGQGVDQAIEAFMPKGVSPRANKMHVMDAGDLTEALDTLLIKGSGQQERKKAMDTMQNIINAYAPGYKNASQKKMIEMSEWLLNRYKTGQENFDIPKMGLVDDAQPPLGDITLYSGHDSAKGSRYFSSDKEYAGIHGKNIREVTVNPNEVFDTRNPQHKQIFDSLNLGRKIDQKTGLPISTGDAKQLESALDKAGHNFKAVALSENTGLGGNAEISYFVKPNVAQERLKDIDPFGDNGMSSGFVEKGIKLKPEPKVTIGRVENSVDNTIDKPVKVIGAEVNPKGKVITNKAGNTLQKGFLEKATNWKDKPKVYYQRERFDRNIESVAGKDAPEMVEKYFKPVQKAEADRQRWLNQERDEIRALGIKGNTKESELLQQYGEKKASLQTLRDELPETWQKVVNAEKVFRQKYDKYLEDINKVLKQNGYNPIPKRQDYFRHFQDVSSVLEKYGIPVRDNSLPTDIVGLTADFKPGKNFFVNALPRKGDKTDFDAIKGIDGYLDGASKQIFHTGNIQNLRLLEKGIREGFAETTHLNNFVSYLSEYTNNLAGKKAMVDRGLEDFVGRNVYGSAQRLRKQIGSNMVGANIASSLTNFIPLTQSLATTSKPAFAKGMAQAAVSPMKNDGFTQKSNFLTARLGSDPLYTGKWDSVANKGFWIFKTIDRFVSETVVRGKYNEGLSKGLSPEQAMAQADNYASRLIGDRSLGSMPNIFNSQTAAFLTQFQLEVNNQVSFLTKDIPKNLGYNKAQVASSLAQVAIYSYLFNELYENFFGRRPAFDPIGIGQQAVEDYTNEDMKKGQATKNTLTNVVNQVPFASTVTGGRIPMSGGIPDVGGLIKGETSLKKELIKPATYILPPTGGSQIKKTLEGLNAYSQGASTTDTGRVRYPIEKTPANLARTAIGGQYSAPGAKDYFREGRTPLGEDQSEVFKSMGNKEQVGIYNSIMGARSAGREEDKLKEEGGGQVGNKLITSDGKVIDLSEPTKGQGIDAYVNQNWKYTKAREVYSSTAPKEAKAKALKQLGVEEKDAEYDYKATRDNDIKAQYVIDKAKSLSREQFMDRMLTGRVESVTGTRFISDGVIDKLEDAGLLSDAEAKALKKIKYDKTGKKEGGSGSGKAKKINLSDAQKVNIKISGGDAPIKMGSSRFAKIAPPKISPFKVRNISDMIKLT